MSIIKIKNLSDKELIELSKKMLLSLNLLEMQTIKKYFSEKNREPSSMELEIIAQTWSEHCIHKTMTSPIEYNGTNIKNLLDETIFKTTRELNLNHCLNEFSDNAGIINFNKYYGIAMKVETHNHPSAIEPYGGASTGIGGVIRDVLGCGKGAKPVLNIDVFCFGRIDTAPEKIPENVIHPKRIFKGVVEGVRDYSNRMGIPTSSGAIIFNDAYISNPLVYCGTIGIIPKKYIKKKVNPGDLIVAIGGRTGRDGIHGATFSSLGLDASSNVSCVQIGDPITEKKFADVLMKLRDMDLINSITDCGAGGFSSAIGEMASDCGAKVYLEKAPLKYSGLKPWEIFLSESQERMILSVSPDKIEKLKELLEKEDVQTVILGEFTDTKILQIYYENNLKAELDLDFIHKGIPKIKRKASWKKRTAKKTIHKNSHNIGDLFNKVISHPNIASKEVVISQYDHEVQGGSVLKPLASVKQDAPQDGCVIRPLLDSYEGIAVGLGINPAYGSIDPYLMALSNCEEAARNLVAAGGDIKHAGFIDNFCWGDVENEKILGELVRAAQGCYDASIMLGVPFVSGKDSLNNFYISKKEKSGMSAAVSIPGTLLITCVAPVLDVRKVIGSSFKLSNSIIYLIGETFDELGGSTLYDILRIDGGNPPNLNDKVSLKILKFIQSAIEKEIILSCHDLSDGGLAVAISEMCFSEIGAEINIAEISKSEDNIISLFSESNSRFLVEVEEKNIDTFESFAAGLPIFKIGFTGKDKLLIKNKNEVIIKSKIDAIKHLYKNTIKW